MPQVITDGLKINYADIGQGEPALLFMPAWCQSRAVYTQVPLKCATHRRVLALDWRGHGQSESPLGDFSAAELLEDALAVIEASGAQEVVPITVAHGGRLAIALRRKLGERIPKIIHTDWLMFPPTTAFVDGLEAMASPQRWQQARDQFFESWVEGVEDNVELVYFVRKEMGSYSGDMWMRAGRAIMAGYVKDGSPLESLSKLNPHVSVLHLYSQPNDLEYWAAQKSFAADNPWFSVHKLQASSHFPAFEVPEEIAATIEKFVA